ncbi:hypothetical protein [Micromonospora ureilytica]|uniref:Uncharacterized protein n=1 Tax=Micromonospora ureilytica TaxID=709868 RepID=A0ABS0JIR5_9ACTN|nr:hypothetical protein [Micromonospora ureilytica]MBG6066356.1 hypothetical protein [Micromonospora ureilytica]WSR53923.1 hypothetical protein OG400_19155 [Micromonospora ureilytica]
MLAADSPTITDWMQGWGSILGLLVSTGALIFTGLLLRHEIAVRREEKADDQAAQARLIIPRLHGAEFKGEQGRALTAVKWVVQNHSEAPVMAVLVRVYPKGAFDRGRYHKAKYVLEPHAKQDGWWELPEVIPWPPEQIEPPLGGLSIDAQFVDSSGLQWRRVRLHPPQRIIGEAAAGYHPRDVTHLPD